MRFNKRRSLKYYHRFLSPLESYVTEIFLTNITKYYKKTPSFQNIIKISQALQNVYIKKIANVLKIIDKTKDLKKKRNFQAIAKI